LDRHGKPLLHLTLPDASRSAPAAAHSIPNDLILCTLAAEDRRFFRHSGIDLLAVLRAARDGCSQQKIVSGASTITQQLIKISSPPAPRTLTTKLRESFVARHLEMSWPKPRILHAYLNRLDYGNLRIGPAEAARFYFQKPLADLSLAECALLAALPQSPSRLNPLRHPQRAIDRRNRILKLLARDQSLPAHRIQAALAEIPTLRPLAESTPPAPWLLPQLAHSAFSSQAIRTTIDLPLQQDANRIVSEETSKLRDANLRHAAAVVIHNPSREILCLVSSSNWRDPRGGEFNGALVPRSPGSTLKPWLYLLAMERKQLVPASILEDIPTPFRTPQGVNVPENYDRRYRGPVTLRDALACSLNVPAMRTLDAIGGPAPLADLLQSLGFDTLGPNPVDHGLGLAIGNAPARLLTLTNSYATLASLGQHQAPKLFLPDAPTETPQPSTFELPIQRIHFLLIADILSDPAARAPAFPPGGPLDLPFRCAVKTGTSSDFRDNWCVGYTPEFTVGVWAGNFENQPMKGISGIAGAAPIFHRLMLRLHQTTHATWFPPDPSLVQACIDRRNGLLLAGGQTCNHARTDWFPAHRLPRPAAASDYSPDGRAILPPSCAAWFAESEHLRHREFASPLRDAPNAPPLQILRPNDGATFLIDPEVPSGTHRLIPQTNPPDAAAWSCPTLDVRQSQTGTVILLKPGRHQLQVTDTRSGTSQTMSIEVKSMAATPR
jgi:penicillin-binding protein 1C